MGVVARVVELADTPDLGIHFWHFQRVSSRYKKSEKVIDIIG